MEWTGSLLEDIRECGDGDSGGETKEESITKKHNEHQKWTIKQENNIESDKLSDERTPIISKADEINCDTFHKSSVNNNINNKRLNVVDNNILEAPEEFRSNEQFHFNEMPLEYDHQNVLIQAEHHEGRDHVKPETPSACGQILKEADNRENFIITKDDTLKNDEDTTTESFVINSGFCEIYDGADSEDESIPLIDSAVLDNNLRLLQLEMVKNSDELVKNSGFCEVFDVDEISLLNKNAFVEDGEDNEQSGVDDDNNATMRHVLSTNDTPTNDYFNDGSVNDDSVEVMTRGRRVLFEPSIVAELRIKDKVVLDTTLRNKDASTFDCVDCAGIVDAAPSAWTLPSVPSIGNGAEQCAETPGCSRVPAVTVDVRHDVHNAKSNVWQDEKSIDYQRFVKDNQHPSLIGHKDVDDSENILLPSQERTNSACVQDENVNNNNKHLSWNFKNGRLVFDVDESEITDTSSRSVLIKNAHCSEKSNDGSNKLLQLIRHHIQEGNDDLTSNICTEKKDDTTRTNLLISNLISSIQNIDNNAATSYENCQSINQNNNTSINSANNLLDASNKSNDLSEIIELVLTYLNEICENDLTEDNVNETKDDDANESEETDSSLGLLSSKDLNRRTITNSRLKLLEQKLKEAGITDETLTKNEVAINKKQPQPEFRGDSSNVTSYEDFLGSESEDHIDIVGGISQFDASQLLCLEGQSDYYLVYDELEGTSSSEEDDEPKYNRHYRVIGKHNMRGTMGTDNDRATRQHNPDRENLKSLLKKPGIRNKENTRKNRVVFNENKNEFFDADYIILIREECDYDDEDDDGVCTCNQHEMVRLTCCEPNCNCNSYDGYAEQTPQSPKFAPPIEFVDAVTLSPPEGYKDMELGEQEILALQQMARRGQQQRAPVCRECSATHDDAGEFYLKSHF